MPILNLASTENESFVNFWEEWMFETEDPKLHDRVRQIESQLQSFSTSSASFTATMGDASTSSPAIATDASQEHLLIVWAFPPSPDSLERLNERFPELKITFKLVDWKDRNAISTITDEEWLSASYICTMANLPPPSLTPSFQLPLSTRGDPNPQRKLRFIQFTSAGINHISSPPGGTPHPIYSDTDVALCTVSGIHASPISEWVVMSILAEGHRLRQMERWQRERTWGNVLGTQGGGMRDSVGKRVGVLGYGSIGRQSESLFS